MPDRIGKPRGARNKLLPDGIVSEFRSRHRTHKDLEETSVDLRAAWLTCSRALVRIIAHGAFLIPAGFAATFSRKETEGTPSSRSKSTQKRKAAT